MTARKHAERSARNGEYLTGYFPFSFPALGGPGRFTLACSHRSYLHAGVQVFAQTEKNTLFYLATICVSQKMGLKNSYFEKAPQGTVMHDNQVYVTPKYLSYGGFCCNYC